MFKKYTLVKYNKSLHDSDAVLIDNNHIICILEKERVSKHKHAMYEFNDDLLVDYIKKEYNIDENELGVFDVSDVSLKYHQHHELHAMASFLSSGYEKSAILVIDGSGDQNDGVTLFAGRNNDIFELKKFDVDVSLGDLYGTASAVLYKTKNSEGKLMGLSCYAEPEYSIPSPIQYHEDGTVENLYFDPNSPEVRSEQLKTYILEKFSYLKTTNNKGINTDLYKAKVAATVQWWFTEQVKNIVKYLKSLLPKYDNLCICGGCFLNCETNGIIDRMGLFKNIYCVPAPADNSIALGVAQQLLLDFNGKAQQIETPYWGPDKKETLEELKEIFKIQTEGDTMVSQIDNLQLFEYSEDEIIKKLKDNYIVAWFDGSSEFGPRALGHRSFLANPELNQTFWDLSVKIKGREYYRPLAPITTEELYDSIFEDPNPENLTQFMLKTVKIKEEWINKIPAVVHSDKTARPQRLKKEINPELHSLITNWNKQTGIPCLINTSLNLKGQPILESYDDLKNLIAYGDFSRLNVCIVINHKLCIELRTPKDIF